MNPGPPSNCPSCGEALSALMLAGLCPRCAGEIIFAPGLPEAGETIRAVPPNRSFGPYEILEEIARGGMGVVFKARHRPLNRTVALKLMLAGQLAGEVEVLRFRAEAEAVARLQHPNIVGIHEVGEEAGFQYFSMDYVEGVNLAELVQGGRLAPRRAAAYLKILAEAVHYAHQQGIIHRDLKPSNVLIDTADRPRITDFGLAKMLDGLRDAPSQLTVTGQVLGTPAFIPPEQAEGRAGTAGPGSDIYSLGAVLYFMVTGRPPFSGTTLEETLSRVVSRPADSTRAINPAVPRDLDTICLKCLEKDPARRYATARELADDLGRFLANQPITARPVARTARLWRSCQRHPAIAGLTAAFASLLLSLAMLVGGRWKTPYEKQGIPDLPVRSVNGVSGVIDGRLYVTTPMDGTDGIRNYFHGYDPRLNSWNKFPEPPAPHESGVGGVVNGKLYLVGGNDWHGKTAASAAQLDIFDPRANRWQTGARMPTLRVRSAAAVYNGKFYVLGGCDPDGQDLGVVEGYDPVRDVWTTEAPMPTPRSSLGAAVLDGRLYAVGGMVLAKGKAPTVEAYDFTARKWSAGPPLPEGRCGSFVTTLDGRLYVAGGDLSNNFRVAASSLLVLNPKRGGWQALASMPEPRFSGDGAQVLDGRIWLIGGWTYETYGGAAHADIFIYDPKLNSWTSTGKPYTN